MILRLISQEELAKKIGVHAPIIGRYEREEVKPSIEMAVKIAQALEVSLDFLTGLSDVELDKATTGIITDLQLLSDTDKNHILTTLNALLRDAKTRAAYK
ncbi:helix-turn-helix domain-containing protein [Empedobacter brevis]|uniref:helix-turn-helix domain-containing protein n=2 Tax=Empedobacter brevis TaxID=247 RepID=UPI00333F6D4E